MEKPKDQKPAAGDGKKTDKPADKKKPIRRESFREKIIKKGVHHE